MLMNLTNQQLADVFTDIADRLEIQGEVVFKTRAYRTIAETLSSYPRPIHDVWQAGELDGVPGVGKAIRDKLDELLRTGRLAFHERLRQEVPDGVAAMLRVPNMGPQRVRLVWQSLGVDGIDALETAARAGRLRELPKMGEKTEQKILAGIASLRRTATGRVRRGDALTLAQSIVERLSAVPGARRVAFAGSLRRGRDTIGDLDILAAARDAAPLMAAFRAVDEVAEVLGSGDTKTSVRLATGLQADLRVVAPEHWGAALQYFTGSQAHNIRLRELAQKRGLSLNEYALTRASDGQAFACAEEAEVYERLGLPLIPPELREDRGEIEAALAGALPRLIEAADLRGDLQMHTTWSDGATDVMGMARAAMALGYQYILITDHTQSLAVANGLTPERVVEQGREIARVNAELKGRFRVLHGVEVEVKSDGSLDLPDEVLAPLDVVQASVHTGLSQPRDKVTARALAALRHPHVDILGHPSGRLINEREGADYDWEAVFHAAAESGAALEINANPARLDLSEAHARRAVELGCRLTISTDAHAPGEFANMQHGLSVARRAWVAPEPVVNTWPVERVLAWAKRHAS
jgi:DNA polymerase (family 10)